MGIPKKVSIIIPAYNEASNIQMLFDQLKEVLHGPKYDYEFIFIDDGSRDSTLHEIKKLCQANNNVFFIQLSRNFGQQNALKAGLDHARGDCVISMDSDLQHPPEIVLQLLEKWEEGYDVVYTKRKGNKDQSWFKRNTSSLFYWLHNQLSDMKLENGTADFRLMSRNIVDAFCRLTENEVFIRGLVKWAGFEQVAIEYTPNARFSGKTKYSVVRMISLAFKGLTSFSTRPLKLVVYMSLFAFIISMFLILYILGSYLTGFDAYGMTPLAITVIFFGSLQLFVIGIIGLYVSKLVIQSKQRPLYFIKESNYTTTQQP